MADVIDKNAWNDAADDEDQHVGKEVEDRTEA